MTRFKMLVLTGILSSFVATTAIAAPQQDHEGKQKHQQTSQHQQVDHKKSTHNTQQPQQARSPQSQQQTQTKHAQVQQDKNTKASNNWKVGGKVPAKYHSNNYKVGHSSHKLPQPGKNQRWIKVNGDYILENVLTHVIIKVITG